MNSSILKTAADPARLAQTAVAAVLLVVIGLSALPAAGQAQKSFATPEEAVKALVSAAKAENMEELLAILGPEAKDVLSSGDPVADRLNRQVVLTAFDQQWKLEEEVSGVKTVVIGYEDWPLPIPLVKEESGWRFDTAAGKEEILFRRIGRNELNTIQACRMYVQVQNEYASRGHDGMPEGLFAQKFASDPGKQNGLYWPAKPGEPLSPLGEFVAEASSEGYLREGTNPNPAPRPFHGYYFRILTAQGPAAPGGAQSYVVNGNMTGGFALVAWPAEYGNSGIMTFIVNHDGIVYEKDSGEDTAAIASQMKDYNPDDTWRKAE